MNLVIVDFPCGIGGEMQCRVKLKRIDLRKFERLAKTNKFEIQAFLVGSVVSQDLIVIDSFHYPKKYALQTAENVQWYGEEVAEVRKYAENLGKRVVGDIHSHIGYDPIMSKEDFDGSIQDGLHVCGICSVKCGKTSTVFWKHYSSLFCEIIYK